ncbi:MAG: glycosyltransferase family 2 protein [Prevotella sp.]|nr:glycosyltransferase family 2 protein [Prevotella sp.]
MKFSFVLPAYKATYLQQAMQSILSQTYSDFELIVVDDCSPEDIEVIVSGFKDERISYFRNEKNIGGHDLVGQWNKCLNYANGEYVILATDDDLYAPEFLKTFVPLIWEYPSVDIFRARVLQVNSNNEILAIDRCYKQYLSSVEFYYHMLHGMKGGIPQYIFRREALVNKGGFVNFPKAWASDDATALMMSGNGVVTSQEHLVRFRNSGINISSDSSLGAEKTKARLMFVEWLRDNLPENEINDEFGRFLRKEINDYLPIYNKTTLISTMKNLTMSKKVRCLKEVVRSNVFSKKDILSISYHTIM